MEDFDTVVFAAIDFWRGKKDNPLTGKTMMEIYQLAKAKGIENIK